MMKKHAFTATSLRMVFTISLFVIVGLGAAVLSIAHSQLKTFATEVSHTTADASASQTTVQTLEKIQQELAQNKEIIERASSIVADSQSYQYQDQIIADLNGYAAKAGIAIASIDFSGDEAPTSGSPTPAKPKASAPAGVKSTSVSIAIKNPVAYESLLRFVKSIEQNLTKMQLSNIGMAKDADSGNINSEDLVIEVYIR